MATKIQELRTQLGMQFDANARHQVVQRVYNRFRYLDLGVGVLGALPGLIFLLLFPLTALVLLTSLPENISLASGALDWLFILLRLIIIALAVVLSYYQISTPFLQPKGLQLEHDMAPALFDQVSELEESYGHAVVERIILQSEPYIRVVKTPRFGQPFFTSNTLVIGLPLLLTLPENHFKLLLARRIGQASGSFSRVSSFLLQLRIIWRSFRNSYARNPAIFARMLHGFFKLYTPFYDYMSFYVARRDELEADRYALEVFNDSDFRNALSQEIITRRFLEKIYWPKIYQLARRSPEQPYRPYLHMTQVIRSGMKNDDVNAWLVEALKADVDPRFYQPPLKMRLENIGHNKPGTPSRLEYPVAYTLFDTEALQKIITHHDNRWLKRLQKKS